MGGNAGMGGSSGAGGVGGSALEQRCLTEQCDVDSMCDPGANPAECVTACENVAGTAANQPSMCTARYNQLFDCVAGLSCEDYLVFKPGSAVDYPCRRQDYDVFIDCGLDAGFCFRSCDVQIGCGSGSVGCAADCFDLFNDTENFSDACANALQTLNQCVSGLDCGQFATYEARTGSYPCQTEQEALDSLMAAGCMP